MEASFVLPSQSPCVTPRRSPRIAVTKSGTIATPVRSSLRQLVARRQDQEHGAEQLGISGRVKQFLEENADQYSSLVAQEVTADTGENKLQHFFNRFKEA